jgi:hypothetical protein
MARWRGPGGARERAFIERLIQGSGTVHRTFTYGGRGCTDRSSGWTMNAAWHAKHPMPPRVTVEQRIAWHLAHAQHCACRPIPAKLRAQMRARRRAGKDAR